MNILLTANGAPGEITLALGLVNISAEVLAGARSLAVLLKFSFRDWNLNKTPHREPDCPYILSPCGDRRGKPDFRMM